MWDSLYIWVGEYHCKRDILYLTIGNSNRQSLQNNTSWQTETENERNCPEQKKIMIRDKKSYAIHRDVPLPHFCSLIVILDKNQTIFISSTLAPEINRPDTDDYLLVSIFLAHYDARPEESAHLTSSGSRPFLEFFVCHVMSIIIIWRSVKTKDKNIILGVENRSCSKF